MYLCFAVSGRTVGPDSGGHIQRSPLGTRLRFEGGREMNRHVRIVVALLAGTVAVTAIVSVAFAGRPDNRDVNGTIWVANRGANTIRAFDAATGSVMRTVAMAANFSGMLL